MTNTAYLSLGANINHPRAQLAEALRRIPRLGNIRQVSSFYETEPVEAGNQPWFVNCALELETTLTAESLLEGLLRIEQEMGRTRSLPKGPRTIDMDLVLFGNQVINNEKLTVPHPAMHLRRFVLTPLAEIAPQVVHPIFKKTAAQLLHELRDDAAVRKT